MRDKLRNRNVYRLIMEVGESNCGNKREHVCRPGVSGAEDQDS